MSIHRAAIWDDRILTEPAPRNVADAIRSVIREHSTEFDAVLKPLGYSVFDVAAPEYEVIIPAEQCPIFVELERDYRWSRPAP